MQPFRPQDVLRQATRAYLLPKLRYQFAEFLLLGSLKRLRILISRTSVGLRYGRSELKLRGFSWNHFQLLREQCSLVSTPWHTPGGFTYQTPTSQEPGLPTPGQSSTIRPPIALRIGAGILTRFPSATAFALTLGADSPYADERCVGNLALTANGLFTRFNATHVSIRTSDTSSKPYDSPSQAYRTLPYHALCASAASVTRLAPLHLPRGTTRSVSYYAFFKGWLLLSQPPDCLCLPTSFPT